MRNLNPSGILTRLFVAALVALAVRPASAQFGFGDDAEPRVRVSAEFTAPQDGSQARLFVTATMEPGWHIYSITQKGKGPIPTQIRLDKSSAFEVLDSFQAHPSPQVKVEAVFGNINVESHHGTVVWLAPIRFAAGEDLSKLAISGAVYAQACSENSCLPPEEFRFTARLGPGVDVPLTSAPAASRNLLAPPPGAAESAPRATPPTPFPPVAEPDSGEAVATDSPGTRAAGEKLKWYAYTNMEDFARVVGTKGVAFDPAVVSENVKKQHSDKSLVWILLGALVGGLILNLMPCVLPVIGLKVLSFVTQAGESRGRSLALNVVYSAGIISVFMVLAALAAGLGLGWGQLFTYAAFNVVLAAIVFAMGLSFLGVWEIPIPGFVGAGKAVQIQQQEGLPAAFLKGIITTVLATPCTGPFMATALTWAVAQPPAIIFTVFFAIGLGMSSPYLLIGAAPGLIKFLPKPGAWMETFKQVMGFFLLGTVVFLLSFLDWPYVVPTIGLLFAIWAGLWWFNRTPITAPSAEKWWAWVETCALIGLAWLLLFPGLDKMPLGRLAFHGLYDEMRERFAARVGDAPAAGAVPVPTEPRPVVVDFTADWCLTCKTLEAGVLESPSVRDAFHREGAILLKADYTHQPPEVKEFLGVLGSKQVPILAVFSPDDPNNPIVFRDGYTPDMVLSALEKARPRS